MSAVPEEDLAESALIDGEPISMVFALRLEKPDGRILAYMKAESEGRAWLEENKDKIARRSKERAAATKRENERKAAKKAKERLAEEHAIKRQFEKIDLSRLTTRKKKQ